MLEFYGRKFTCDECPICEGIEHRVRVAREGGYEPQLEYCGCDKVQTEFLSVVIVAMLLSRTSRRANCVNRENRESISAQDAQTEERKADAYYDLRI